MHFGEESHRRGVIAFLVRHNTGFTISACLIIGDVMLDHLEKVISAGLIHYKVAISPALEVSKYLAWVGVL